MNGIAKLTQCDDRQCSEEILEYVLDAIDKGWGVDNASSSWIRWAPRAFNALPDFLCNQSLKHEASFGWTLNPLPNLEIFNRPFRTDGGRWMGSGSASAWVLLGIRKHEAPLLIAFAVEYTRQDFCILQSELRATYSGAQFLFACLNGKPSPLVCHLVFLPGVVQSLREAVASATPT